MPGGFFLIYCKRKYFRGEFNFAAFVYLKKKNSTKLISIPKFLPPGLQVFRLAILAFTFLGGQFESTVILDIFLQAINFRIVRKFQEFMKINSLLINFPWWKCTVKRSHLWKLIAYEMQKSSIY